LSQHVNLTALLVTFFYTKYVMN